MVPDPDRDRAERIAARSDPEWKAVDRLTSEYDREPSVERRRVIDERFEAIERSIGEIKREVSENTEITKQIRDVITSFTIFGKIARGLGRLAKWLAGLAAAVFAVYHAWQKATGR